MTTLAEALDDIYAIEALLSISSPVSIAAGAVTSWPYTPPSSQVITDTPAILHSVAPTEVAFEAGGWARVQWSVHCKLMVYDADLDQASKIAAAFIEPLIETFAQYIKLDQRSGWFLKGIRFSGEQPVLFLPESDSAGKTFIGLNYYLDLSENKTIPIAAGSLP